MSTPPPSRLSVVIHLQHSAGFAERFLSDQYPPSLRALLAQPSPPFLGPSAVPGQARRVVFHSSLNESQQVLTLPGSYTPTTLLSDIRRDLEAQFPHVPICRGSRFRRPREPWDEVRLFEDSETIGHAWQVIHKEEEEEHAELVAWDQQSSSFSSRSSQDEGIDAAVGSMEGSDSGQVKLGTSGDAGSSADAGGDVSRIENAGEKSPPAQESSPDPSRDPGAGEIHLLVCTTAGHLAELDGTILTNFLSWKRSAVRLSYLQKQDRDIPENSEMQQSKFLERQHREDLWRKLDEWDELISGVEAPEPVAEEKENRQEKEADIYVRMEKWNKMRKEKVETVADTEAEPVVVVHGFDDDSWEPPDPEEALLFPGISPADSASIVAVAIPRGDQGSDPPGPTDQSSFTVRSGVLLWGHLQTVFHGSNSQSFDSIVPPPALKGGTIVERILNYRAAARNGQWRVRKAYSNTGAEDEYAEPKRHFGHVVHHESVDPMEVLWWCAGKMGSSLDGEKEVSPFKDILNIGRYDWSWLRDIGSSLPLRDYIQRATGLQVADEQPYFDEDHMLPLRTRWGGFCMLVDADEFGPEFLGALIRDCPARKGMYLGPNQPTERVFVRRHEPGGVDGDAIGAWMACGLTEYEFGWLVFSGKKHSVHTEADELIAVVYDGNYDRLEGTRFAVSD